jgi:hypothetical protein
MPEFLKSLSKIIFVLLIVNIVSIYFIFEEKNDFVSSQMINKERNNKKTNFTKITKYVHVIYIFLVTIFLFLAWITPKKLFR